MAFNVVVVLCILRIHIIDKILINGWSDTRREGLQESSQQVLRGISDCMITTTFSTGRFSQLVTRHIKYMSFIRENSKVLRSRKERYGFSRSEALHYCSKICF